MKNVSFYTIGFRKYLTRYLTESDSFCIVEVTALTQMSLPSYHIYKESHMRSSLITTDYHLHSSFSADSSAPMRRMVERGIALGLSSMCFTEHMDYDYKDDGMVFEADIPAYRKTLFELKEEYSQQINLLFGVELGLQPYLKERCEVLVKQWDFDFVIGSSHVVEGQDPYYPTFYEGRTEEESYRLYFQSVIDNLNAFSCFDVYGHIDYVVRYGPQKNKFYSYRRYKDQLDEILRLLIHKGAGLELNTGGFQHGLGEPNPSSEIIARYKEMGGEIITVGSDAHSPDRIAADFDRARDILLACGFQYYTVFQNRKPEFLRLQ